MALSPYPQLAQFASRAFPAILAISILITGCVKREDLIVWKAESRSADGRWLATADTIQNGGFGSGDIYTTVHLSRTGGKQSPVDVVGIDSQGPMPHPYVLDNVSNKGGSIELTMTWVSPTHLQVGYVAKPGTIVELQMVKYAGVDISLQGLSGHALGPDR
jgi:hypothetical protein